MLYAEAIAMLRRDGYLDAAELMEEQAVQLKVTMKNLADCKAELSETKQSLSLAEASLEKLAAENNRGRS